MKEEILLRHLSRWSLPFVWGNADCMMSVFNYVNDFPHISGDVGVKWRQTYSDEAGAARVLEAAGGGLAGMNEALIAAGLKFAIRPERGDPVCARIDGNEIGGIYLGKMTAFRLDGRGRIDAHIKHIGAWRL